MGATPTRPHACPLPPRSHVWHAHIVDDPGAWCIVVVINSGYIDFFLNWWASYDALWHDHEHTVVVAAEDQAAYDTISALGLKGVALEKGRGMARNVSIGAAD